MPYFFGQRGSELFACYHEPPDPTSERGVVLCYPMGHEYVFTHRLYCHVAKRLAARGLHVLRFDFFATGDSAGSCEEARVERWVADAVAAVDELHGRTSVESIDIAGLRMGGTVALLAAARHRRITRVALWDPVVKGREYLNEVLALEEDMLPSPPRRATPSARSGEGRLREAMGFPLSDHMLEDLLALDLLRSSELPTGSCFLVDTSSAGTQREVGEHLERHGLRLRYEPHPYPKIWAQDPYQSLLPHAVIDTVVQWLGERGA